MSKTFDNEDVVPGTVNLIASKYDDEENAQGKHLKKNKNGIILLPQPSDSPNDPLNWSLPRKMLHFIIVSVITGLTAATSNVAGSAQDSLNEIYGISYDAMNTGAGILFLFIGWSCIFLAPASSLYGRRITYIICLLSGALGSVWFGKANKLSDTLWSQAFVGLSESCAEAQAQQSLSDIFFQHQLGGALTVYILATSVGTFLGPLIAGYIDSGMGFRWIGWWSAILSGFVLIVVIFACEETVFDRTKYIPVIDSYSLNEELAPVEKQAESDDISSTQKHDEKMAPTPTSDDRKVAHLLSIETADRGYSSEAAQVSEEKKKSYWQQIQIITPSPYLIGTGFKQYIYRFFLYFKVFTIPAVWFSGILWGLQDAYLTFYITTQDDYFSDTPYFYSGNRIALMNIPTLIGAIIGCIMSGIGSDYHVIWLAKRNNNIYEPELRLWLLSITMIISPVGLIMFGVGAAREWPWQVVYVGLGFIGFGWGSIGDTAMSYLMDSYPEIVIQGMVGVSIINNTLACIFTFTCSLWLELSGTQNAYIALAVIDFVTIAFFIPMYIWGKDCRRLTKNIYLNLVELTQGM